MYWYLIQPKEYCGNAARLQGHCRTAQQVEGHVASGALLQTMALTIAPLTVKTSHGQLVCMTTALQSHSGRVLYQLTGYRTVKFHNSVHKTIPQFCGYRTAHRPDLQFFGMEQSKPNI